MRQSLISMQKCGSVTLVNVLNILIRLKEQKPPARGGFTPSEMSAGRRHFEAYKRVSPSADGDLRNFLKKVP